MYILKKHFSFSFFFLLLFFVCSVASAQENEDIMKQIKETSDPIEQLDILNKVLIDNQMSDPKAMLRYAAVFDSIAQIVDTEETSILALNFKGNADYANENYTEAIDSYITAVKKLETQKPITKETNKRLSEIYNNLAGCYRASNDFENIEKYFKKSLSIAMELDDKVGIARSNNNLAVVYMDNKMFEKAKEMYSNALEIYKAANDTLMMGVTYMNVGNSYIASEEYTQAIPTYEKAQQFVPMKMVPLLHSVSQTGIGISYTAKEEYNKALPYLLKGKKIADEIGHFEQLMESNVALADYYSKTNKYKEAFELQIETQFKKDSVRAIKEQETLVNAMTKFETEKKDAELKVLKLESENAKQEKITLYIVGITILMIAIIIAFFLAKNFKQNKLLAKQKVLLEASVDEKNILLKETHHRVKNSFQIVSSLLYLQSENTDEKEAKIAIKEAENRVRSMVLIHQKLYSKDELIGIDTKEYLQDLVTDIFESHLYKDTSIHYKLNAASLILYIESVTPIGLILNELIVNTIKHAFDAGSTDNIIEIQFKKENNHLVLTIKDNGKGFSGEVKNTSFGITLMKALSKKLDATLSYTSEINVGTEATLVMTKYKELS